MASETTKRWCVRFENMTTSRVYVDADNEAEAIREARLLPRETVTRGEEIGCWAEQEEEDGE